MPDWTKRATDLLREVARGWMAEAKGGPAGSLSEAKAGTKALAIVAAALAQAYGEGLGVRRATSHANCTHRTEVYLAHTPDGTAQLRWCPECGAISKRSGDRTDPWHAWELPQEHP
jgi:hypothetical protein